jgi:hypothetical protein
MMPDPVHCIDCVRFDLRGHADMARLGYGRCALQPRAGHFDSATYPRHCTSFEPAQAEIAALRRQWLTTEHEKFFKSITGASHDRS